MRELFCSAFDRVVNRYPEHVAVEQDGRRHCRYRELQSMSRGIAGLLQSAGVERQSVVAIRIEKSIEYIASLIGIWRAGCIALPLPDVFPAAVRMENGDRAGVAAVLQPDPSSSLGVQLEWTGRPRVTHAGDLAYIFFTSGSTGSPKGVAVTHRGLVPVLKDQIDAFGLSPETRSLFYLSICFDASLSDIGTALLSGGTLVIESEVQSSPPAALMRCITERRITYADLPPAIVSRIGKLKLAIPESLSTVVVGGEVCSAEGIDWFSDRLNLFNVYGPTEATICTSIKPCRPGVMPTIGTPIAGMRYRIGGITGDRVEDVAADGEGELWIAGPGLAAGYIGDPKLTAQKFVMLDGTRWYRTGDRVRREGGGEYRFVGRVDRQFKLLGKLVEPEEIRRRLLEHPTVAEAAVVPLQDDRGSVRAVAALVCPTDPSTFSLVSLREHLRNGLPAWMVPTTIKVVDSIERTATGKADLHAATALATEHAPDRQPPPDSVVAETLHTLWVDVLGHDDFGWDDPLDAVGGNSLAAMELLALARAGGISLQAQCLQSQTLRECVSECVLDDPTTTQRLERIVQDLARAVPELPKTGSEASCNRVILLTGATGFLGTWVLDALVAKQTGARLRCLVRAADASDALDRINQSRTTFLGRDALPLRRCDIEPICGDIAAARLGLSEAEWTATKEQVTDIVHLAARVHLLEGFHSMRGSNLDPITTLAELASRGRPKAIRYASTLSVFVSTDRALACYEESDRLDESARVFGGYAQTKWAAERLLWAIARQQTPSVFRLGLLTGDSRFGVGPDHDQLAMFTRGIARLGVYPQGIEEFSIDVTPVDQAANALVTLTLGNHTGAFHLCGPAPVTVSRWIAAMNGVGPELTPVSRECFALAARQYQAEPSHCPSGRQDVAAACLALDYRSTARSESRPLDLFLATATRFDCTRTNQLLRSSDERIHAVTDRQLETMVVRMLERVRSGVDA
ncbi:Linear gramicidin synthase subunit D [Stieleria maiorica]|uniref:Linear gramicidin synthase subunit D n=1 Tax=Stieleria maiorica TaxID=2795974 RepID=A0A5B9MGM8_9BACT|nr:AMP-binding protein [Stieleria maiorica]QEG00432.1 Linear gramicidin synthase subunit D [Stieleria maiorica]